MDKVAGLVEELKDIINSSYNKFSRNIIREFNKAIEGYELSSKDRDTLNEKILVVFNKIKNQTTDSKKSLTNDMESLVSDFVYIAQEQESGPAIKYDFNGYWRGNWYINNENAFGWENSLIFNDNEHGRILKIMHKIGSSCQQIQPNNIGGLQFFNNFKENYNKLILEYNLRFDDSFKFCRGGRLPGLYGGEIISESQIPTGINGFLGKLAWNSNGLGELILNVPAVKSQNIFFYKGGNWIFRPGKWHNIKQEIHLNDVGKSNGMARIMFDNKEALTITDVCFRTSNEVRIKGMAFTNYYGENDKLAGCPADTFVEFSYFTIHPLI